MTWDDIDVAIAREEHRQGMPVTPHWGHCPDCDSAAHAARRERLARTCDHVTTISMTTLCDDWRRETCARCGKELPVDVTP